MNKLIVSASSLLGEVIRTPVGEKLGLVEDVMLDTESGEIAYVVMGLTGLFSKSRKLFAVPWRAFLIDFQKHELVLDADPEAVRTAPGFDRDNWPNFADPHFSQRIFRHYNLPANAPKARDLDH